MKNETRAYRFGEARTRELLECYQLEEWQVESIAHDMALEWDRVLDGLTEALSRALLFEAHATGRGLSARQAKAQIRALLGGR